MKGKLTQSHFVMTLLLLCIVFHLSTSLHFLSSEQYMKQRFSELYAKQKSFESRVGQTLDKINQTESQIAKETNNTKQAEILEKAIVG